MKNQRLVIGFISLIAFGLAINVGIFLFQREKQKPKLPVLGQVKGFLLIDSQGEEFSSRQLESRVWVANFFFTTCSDVCPVMSKHMASLSRSFELAPAISLVSITVNPENDSPEILQQYAKRYGAGKNWYFLTGKREDITRLAVETFKIGSIEEPVFHSTYFPLVDRHGTIRGYYDGTDQEAINKLFKDAAELLKER